MTSPKFACNVVRKGRHYPLPPTDLTHLQNGRGSIKLEDLPDSVEMVPSVTNVISTIDKPGLRYWYAEQAIREMYDSGAIPTDVEVAVDTHRTAGNRERDKRAGEGDRAHTLAEVLTDWGDLPLSISEVDESFADSFLKWYSDLVPTETITEKTMFMYDTDGNPCVAGTADLLANISGVQWVVDYKSKPAAKRKHNNGSGQNQKILYPEHRLQLSALANATTAIGETGTLEDVNPAAMPVGAMCVYLYDDGEYEYAVMGRDELRSGAHAMMALKRVWDYLREIGA